MQMLTKTRRAGAVLGSVVLLAGTTMASAGATGPAEPNVSAIVLTTGTTQLQLSFDEPISEREALASADRLDGTNGRTDVALVEDGESVTTTARAALLTRPTVQPEAATLAVSAAATGVPLSCGNGLATSDSNGRLTLDYACHLTPKRLFWSYKLSATVRKIVVGPVSESGLRWWRNGASQPQNAPHVEGAAYLFHGTMKPVPLKSDVDYQDVLTFRHNIGSGGTARVVWAGSVVTKKVEGA